MKAIFITIAASVLFVVITIFTMTNTIGEYHNISFYTTDGINAINMKDNTKAFHLTAITSEHIFDLMTEIKETRKS